MKVSLDQVLQAESALRKLATTSLPAVTAFHVSRLLKEVNEHYRQSKEIEMKLFEKYGVSDGKGNLQVLPVNEQLFKKELVELLAIEVEVSAKALKIEQLESVSLTPAEIFALEPFLEV